MRTPNTIPGVESGAPRGLGGRPSGPAETARHRGTATASSMFFDPSAGRVVPIGRCPRDHCQPAPGGRELRIHALHGASTSSQEGPMAPEPTRISRRRFLRYAGVSSAILGFGAPARAAARTEVSMRLDWLFQGPNVGFVVAKDKGYYDKAGLEVTIGAGRGSGSTAQLIASKTAMIGFSDGYVVGNTVAKGASIRMVAAIYRRNPTAIVVLADSDIKSPRDLEGKSVGIPTGGAPFQQWPAFVKGCGVDASKVQIVNVDPAGAPPALITGKVPAISGYAQGFVPMIEIRGNKKARILWYTDCGVTA